MTGREADTVGSGVIAAVANQTCDGSLVWLSEPTTYMWLDS